MEVKCLLIKRKKQQNCKKKAMSFINLDSCTDTVNYSVSHSNYAFFDVVLIFLQL